MFLLVTIGPQRWWKFVRRCSVLQRWPSPSRWIWSYGGCWEPWTSWFWWLVGGWWWLEPCWERVKTRCLVDVFTDWWFSIYWEMIEHDTSIGITWLVNVVITYSGWWWLEPWNVMTFHSVGNVIIPTDKLIFFRGVGTPPTRWVFMGGNSIRIIRR